MYSGRHGRGLGLGAEAAAEAGREARAGVEAGALAGELTGRRHGDTTTRVGNKDRGQTVLAVLAAARWTGCSVGVCGRVWARWAAVLEGAG